MAYFVLFEYNISISFSRWLQMLLAFNYALLPNAKWTMLLCNQRIMFMYQIILLSRIFSQWRRKQSACVWRRHFVAWLPPCVPMCVLSTLSALNRIENSKYLIIVHIAVYIRLALPRRWRMHLYYIPKSSVISTTVENKTVFVLTENRSVRSWKSG